MSRRMFRFAIAVLGLVSACSSSPPTRFYMLSETAPGAQPAQPAPQSMPPAGVGSVRVDRVTIPGELDRPQVVRRLDANRLQIEELDRWAAPLDEMIRRVLTGDIGRRWPGGTVDVVGDGAGGASIAAPGAGGSGIPGRQRSLTVDIREFYGDASCNVVLRAAWTPKQAHPETAQSMTEEVRVPSTGACPDSLPATMSAALGQLSERIVAGIARQP